MIPPDPKLPGMVLVQLKDDGILSYMHESELIRTTGIIHDEKERTTWVEYRLKSDPDAERPVHRSVDMHLKTPMVWGFGETAKF